MTAVLHTHYKFSTLVAYGKWTRIYSIKHSEPTALFAVRVFIASC